MTCLFTMTKCSNGCAFKTEKTNDFSDKIIVIVKNNPIKSSYKNKNYEELSINKICYDYVVY